jgi:hypothetical protein
MSQTPPDILKSSAVAAELADRLTISSKTPSVSNCAAKADMA